VVETPAVTRAPVITGTLTDAAVVTAGSGEWTPADPAMAFAYEWLRCPADASGGADAACTALSGSARTVTLRAEDVGFRLAVRVTATRQGASASVVSALTGVVVGRPLASTAPPAVSGTPELLETLTASAGSWSVPTTATTWQWLRCDANGGACADVDGATGPTYRLQAADVGRRMRVRVRVSSPGREAAAESDPSPVVAPLPPPRLTGQPSVAGVALRGRPLHAHRGTWTGLPSDYAYQWLRCDAAGGGCSPVAGATAPDYTPVAADVGQALRATVTAANAAGAGVPATTAATAPVGRQPLAIRGVPALAPGQLKVGAELRATAPQVDGAADTTLAWQWQRCGDDGDDCRDVPGATDAALALTNTDIDHTLRVRLTAANPDGTAAATSAVSAVVVPAPPVMAAPVTLRGTAQVGQTVTARPGRWLNTDRTAVQLYRCAATCIEVAAAGQLRHTLTDADTGTGLRAAETGTGRGGEVVRWAAGSVGPIRSATAGQATIALGQAAPLRTGGGDLMGSATVVAPRALASAAQADAGRVVVRVRRAPGVAGRLRAWACPVGGTAWQPCSPRRTLGAAPLRLPVAAGRRVQVTILPARRR
jgi:hypothetical protein